MSYHYELDVLELNRQDESAEFISIRDEYITDAERDENDDWVNWDEEGNKDALVKVWRMLNNGDADSIADARQAIRNLIEHAADKHAEQCMNNK